MPGLLPDIDPDGLLEFSVVYTDRALNHVQTLYRRAWDILGALKEVYHAHTAVLVPGSGTFGMEPWRASLPTSKSADRAQRLVQPPLEPDFDADKSWAAAPSCARPASRATARRRPGHHGRGSGGCHRAEKPKGGVCPHVETASGIMLSDDYLRTLTAAAHEWVRCSCSTAPLPRGRCGWTCRPRVSMC